MKIAGSVVLITGGVKRIGRVISLQLASRGATLILHFHRSQKEATVLKKQIEKKFRTKVHLLRGDLREFSQVRRLAEQAWKITKRLDVLINNASTFFPTSLGEVSEAQWEDLFQVNARAPFFLSEYLGKKMKDRGKGKIINIADFYATRPSSNFIPYCASKASLLAITQGMAKALAPEVQVNAILPGPILWPEGVGEKGKKDIIQKTPLGRIGKPEDIAGAVRYLIEDADYVTGSQLMIDGGRNIF